MLVPAPAVEVTDLRMVYGPVTAVDGLSLTVETGTITAILGPNGAGKTTTIETCEGFRAPQSGEVRIFGADPIIDAQDLRPRVGVMLQSGGSWSSVRAADMVRHLARLYANPLNPEALCARLGIDDFASTPYRRLSGGQQQRLNLAMALVGRPELIFFDEPTAGLDTRARHDAWALFDELRSSGVTAVLCTHHLDEAEALADYVYIVHEGRLAASGTPAELGHPDGIDVVTIKARAGLDVEALDACLPSQTSAAARAHGRYEIQGRIDPAVVARALDWFAEQGVLVDAVKVGTQSLEDRFLQLTAERTP